MEIFGVMRTAGCAKRFALGFITERYLRSVSGQAAVAGDKKNSVVPFARARAGSR